MSVTPSRAPEAEPPVPMSEPATIRAATAADLAAIVKTLQRAFAEYDRRLEPQPGALRETGATLRSRAVPHGAAVAVAGGHVIGCVLFERRGRELYLGRLAVVPEWRGRGIARLLVEHVEHEARAAGAAAVTLNVRVALPENITLFSRLGYHEVGRLAHKGFSDPTFLVMMKKTAG